MVALCGLAGFFAAARFGLGSERQLGVARGALECDVLLVFLRVEREEVAALIRKDVDVRRLRQRQRRLGVAVIEAAHDHGPIDVAVLEGHEHLVAGPRTVHVSPTVAGRDLRLPHPGRLLAVAAPGKEQLDPAVLVGVGCLWRLVVGGVDGRRLQPHNLRHVGREAGSELHVGRDRRELAVVPVARFNRRARLGLLAVVCGTANRQPDRRGHVCPVLALNRKAME